MNLPIGCIILTGGKSTRMGAPKQSLLWDGKPFLTRMQEKARALGAAELLFSGGTPDPARRVIPDLYPGAGPLSGIYSCLCAASCELLLVLPVDLPQLPVSLLREMLAGWTAEIDCMLLQNGTQPEPLVSLWRKSAAPALGQRLKDGDCSVLRAARALRLAAFPYQGDPRLVSGCNTPQAYQALCAAFENR